MNDLVYNNVNPELVKEVVDNEIGLKGYLVIDSTINGQSIGGLRIRVGLDKDEIINLAHSMTLKQSFVGIPRGGAKAGIVIKEHISDSKKVTLLKRFGELTADYLKDRKYISGSDIGTDTAMINKFYESAGLKITKQWTGCPNSGYFTSLSVLVAIEECIKIKKLDFQKCTFAIQGFGSVGSSLALEIYKLGGKIIAISDADGAIMNENGLKIPEIINLVKQNKSILHYKDATQIDKDKLLELEVTVLCPCALAKAITNGNKDNIKADIVCAGANEAVTVLADRNFFNRGIIFLPEFATNCGGVLGNAMEFMGIHKRKILKLYRETLTKKYRFMHEISKKTQTTPREVAMKIAMNNFERMKNNNKLRSVISKIHTFALQIYYKGMIPKFLVKNYAYNYFKKCLLQDVDLYESYVNYYT